MSLWYTRCSNYPTESSARDGMPFVTWLVVRVDVALGLNTFFFFFSCVCAFLTVKRKEKKVKRFFFPSSGNHCAVRQQSPVAMATTC